MVNADEFYGEYLKGEDLKGDLKGTIESVALEKVGEDEKLVVRMHDIRKGLVLNKTNKDRLKAQFGTPETDQWIGKEITITTEEIEFGGKKGPALRIKNKEEGAKSLLSF